MCGAGEAIGCVSAKAAKSHASRRENMNVLVNVIPGGQDRERESGSLLEAMGHVVAKATWPVDRTDKCTNCTQECRSGAPQP